MRVRYVGRLAARHLSRGDRALARIVLVPPFPRRYEPSGIGGAQEGSDLLVRDLAEVAVEGADRAEVARGSETHDPIGLALAPRGVLSASAQYWNAREKKAPGAGPRPAKRRYGEGRCASFDLRRSSATHKRNPHAIPKRLRALSSETRRVPHLSVIGVA